MKTQPVLFFVLCLLLLVGGCVQKPKRAKTYHEQVLRTIQAVIDSSLDFGDAVQSYNKTKAVQGFEQYANLVNQSITKVKSAGAFDDDTTLQHGALDMLLFYQTTLETGFKPLVQSIQSDEFTPEQKATADSLYTQLTMNESRYWQRFSRDEKRFDQKFELDSSSEK